MIGLLGVLSSCGFRYP